MGPREKAATRTSPSTGEKRTNQTHASRTDPDARLCRIKGKEAKLSYRGHLLIENRNGLIVSSALTVATGKAEEKAALDMLAKKRSAEAAAGSPWEPTGATTPEAS